MTTEKNELSESSIVQTQRIDDAKFIVELLSDGIYSHLQYWSVPPSKVDYSRTDFLHAYNESEERFLIFQRQFLHYLVISPWKLDQVKEKLEKIKKDSMFNAFISMQVHHDELENVRPEVGFLGFDSNMGGMFDRLVKSSLLYGEHITVLSVRNNLLDFPVSWLDVEYLLPKPKGMKERDIKIITTFAHACIDGMTNIFSEREWDIIHLGGCYSRRDPFDVKVEVESLIQKLLPVLIAQLKQVFNEHTNQKELRRMFELIGNHYLKHKNSQKTPSASNDISAIELAGRDPHTKFKILIDSSLTFHDVDKILSFDPKIRTISFPHIVGRLLRVSSWYSRVNTSTSKEMNCEEIKYLKELALSKE